MRSTLKLPLRGLVRFYRTSNIFLRDTKYRAGEKVRSNTLKRNELKVYISLLGNKLAFLSKS